MLAPGIGGWIRPSTSSSAWARVHSAISNRPEISVPLALCCVDVGLDARRLACASTSSYTARAPWWGLDDVEFATLEYLDWFNQRRLHGDIEPGPGYTIPAAFEADHHPSAIPAHQGEDSTN